MVVAYFWFIVFEPTFSDPDFSWLGFILTIIAGLVVWLVIIKMSRNEMEQYWKDEKE